jgi:membrane-bound lytic murein transglycosylase B
MPDALPLAHPSFVRSCRIPHEFTTGRQAVRTALPPEAQQRALAGWRARWRATALALVALGVLGLALLPSATWAQASAPIGARAEVLDFARDVAARHALDTAWVAAQLAQARRVATIQRLILPAPPGTARDWSAYRSRFVEPERIAAGVGFWAEHAATLARAEARYGVPAHIVVGILGVETYFGRVMGNHRVIDALATLGFDFPAAAPRDRSAFFRDELEAFLVQHARAGTDPQQPRGSFAGAWGLPQFMPTSLARWAVDFDGDGRIDLAGSPADAIGSVANYLAAHGWARDMPTHYAVDVPVEQADRAALLAPDILPSFTPAQFAERGARLPAEAAAHDGLLALVMLENGRAAPTHIAGTANFYAITRYNRSSYYALGVIHLGEAIAAARSEATTAGR